MNGIYKVFFLMLLMSSCKEYDIEINSKYLKPLNTYSTNSIIYFENQYGDLDTIKIIGIDSTEVKRNYLGSVPPMKNIYLRIQHLPKDNWKVEKPEFLNKKEFQSLIKISKHYIDNDKTETYTEIKYRDFSGYVNSYENKVDTIKSEITEFKQTDEKVEIVYWSKTNGIIGYKKRNGQTYNLKKQ